MNAYPLAPEYCSSFREIDQELGLPKGSSFRAFKRIEAELAQGRDYVLLLAGEDHATIARLREAGRVYASSRNVVLLSAATRARLLELLQAPQ